MKKAGTPSGVGYVVHKKGGNCRVCVYTAFRETIPASAKRYTPETCGDTKRCKKCLEFLPYTAFYPSKILKDGYSNDCRECDDLNRHGISKAVYHALLLLQRHRCAICKTHVSDLKRRLYIDHDHSCCDHPFKSCGKCVRGLLCISCNSGIGLLKDSKDVVASALDYLNSRKMETDG